jgi:magnesium-transporting ATPase (P-type)
MNALASVLQEVRAEKAMEALKGWVPESAKAFRDGRLQRVMVRDLVPGDVLSLDQGDRVPADARLLEAYDFWVNNIPLTGEATPQHRIANAASNHGVSYLDAENLVFMSTSVVRGHGKAVIFATGAKTKFGEIASLALGIPDPASPLEKEIAAAARLDLALAMLLGTVFLAVALVWLGLPFYAGILFMIGVMVSLVPEGLQLTLSSALAINTVQMARQNVLVKRLSAVQTLGSVTVICTDKTGTITKAEMTVRKLLAGDVLFDVSGLGYDLHGFYSRKGRITTIREFLALDKLIETATLCNSAELTPSTKSEPGKGSAIVGDALDGALLIAALKYGLDIQKLRQESRLVHVIPFTPERKRATTVHESKDGSLVCMKGAPLSVFSVCTKALRADGTLENFTPQYSTHVENVADEFAREGLRVIACAYRLQQNDASSENRNVEQDLIFLGLVGMYDPPRSEVKEAVRIAKEAGIDVVIITGDSELTTQAVAAEVGITEPGNERVLRGEDLTALTDTEIVERIRNGTAILARVSPADKFRIVTALRNAGEIVAVTGDGANDAPSLKEADIGVAMGASGTDIARESADLVLLDDSFASIVKAVESGRVIYDNIRRFIGYVFSHNWAQLIPFFLYMLLGIPLPLLVMQILAIDLFIEILPSLAISREPAETGIMNLRPRSVEEHLLNSKVLLRSLFVGTVIAAGAMVLCLASWSAGGWHWGMTLDASSLVYVKGTTMTFAGIVFGQIGNVLSSRTNRVSIFRTGFSRNKWILWAIAAQAGILALFVYLPWLQPIFGTTALSALDWAYLLLITTGVIAAEEVRKLVIRAWKRQSPLSTEDA